jgi:acyl-CoA synthetase (NDP forming)
LLYATDVDQQTVEKLIAEAVAGGRNALSEIESKRVLAAAGIATAVPEFAASADDAVKAAARIGFPVVLKVHSPDVSHKSEVGGVALNLHNEPQVREAFDRIRRGLHERMPGARFEGVAVDRQAHAGVELIAGISRDDRFGPLVVVGLGGIFVEVLHDTAMRLAPIDRDEAKAMLAELRGAPLLHGARGAAPVDIDAIADLLVRLSELAASRNDIIEMDLNPVVAYEQGISVLDARILIAPGGAPKPATPAATDPERHQRRIENLTHSFDA